MVGNGVTDWTFDTTPAFVQLAYDEVLLEDSLYDRIQKLGCNYGTNHPYDGISTACKAALIDVMNKTNGINTYNTYGICYGKDPFPQLKSSSHGVSVVDGVDKVYKRHYTAADYTPWMFEGLKEANGAIPPCIYGTPVAEYFNRVDIRELLHIPTYVQAWELCTGNIDYTTSPNASLWAYEALRGKYRVLKYSGDVDGSVPTLGTRGWINSTDWAVTEAYRPYTLENQLIGYVEVRENWFTFGSIHGAGHMAPQYKPPETYHLIFNWLHQTPI